MSSATATIAVLGAGSWGATLAAMLAHRGHRVRLWTHREEELLRLAELRHPPGVPELRLPAVTLTTNLPQAISGADAALIAIPAQTVGALCRQLAGLGAVPPLIIASKGIDIATLQPLSELIESQLPGVTVGVVSGPCIAREVALGIPTSVVAASESEALSRTMQEWLASPTFRVYRQEDVLGVEYGGALKNVIAIAAGVGDGLGFGANSKSALLTRGLAEMSRFAVAHGAKASTIAGLAGLGDLCVTCFSPYSRNRRFGEALGKGGSAAEAMAAIGETVEGAPTAEAVVREAARKGIEVPIAEAVTRIIAGEWSPRDAVGALMTRGLKEEF